MSHDAIIRTAALVAAGALLAAPYWDVIGRHLAEGTKAAWPYRTDIARVAAAALLIYAACGVGLVPIVRNYDWSLANVVTAAKVIVGLACIGSAFVEATRWCHATVEARMRHAP